MRSCTITLHTQDNETGEYTGTNSAYGMTPDGGQTVVIGPGFLPGLAGAKPDAVKIIVDQPPMEVSVASLAVSVDEDSGKQVITVTPMLALAEVV